MAISKLTLLPEVEGGTGVMPFWASPCVTIYQADSHALPLADGSIDCVVTSPPYWGLRTYQGQEPTLQLGHEPTIVRYVERLVGIMREVRRVMKPWATLWLNLGDSYMGGGNTRWGSPSTLSAKQASNRGTLVGDLALDDPTGPLLNLAGIPWRVALAMQEGGWVLRQDIIWHKPDTMPESVSGWRWARHRVRAGKRGRGREASKSASGSPQQDHDGRDFLQDAQLQDSQGSPACASHDGLVLRKGNWRPTTAHEHIFLFAKSQSYFCNAEAVREPPSSAGRRATLFHESSYPGVGTRERWPNSGRNLRSVWTITSPNSAYEHYATFPEKLVEPCILAGTSERGNCSDCGMPWVPVVESKPMVIARSGRNEKIGISTGASGTMLEPSESLVVGWLPSCSCPEAELMPPLVLDPFAGTGTTGVVAQKLGRRAVLVDISEEYCQMMQERLEGVPLPMELG